MQENSYIFDKVNTISLLLKIIGWVVMIVGIIGGFIVLGLTNEITSCLIIIISCVIFSMLFFALGEITQILHDIRLKVYKK